MRFVFLTGVFSCLVLMSARGTFAEGPPALSGESFLDRSLSSLRQSVELLSNQNHDLAVQNERLNAQLVSLRDRESVIKAEEEKIDQQTALLEAALRKRQEPTKTIKSRIAEIDREIQKLEKALSNLTGKVSARSAADDNLRASIGELEKDIARLQSTGKGLSFGNDDKARELQADQEQLTMALAAADLSLQAIQDQWAGRRGELQLDPSALRKAKSKSVFLSARLRALQTELNRLNDQAAAQRDLLQGADLPRVVSDARHTQLLAEVAELTDHYRGLAAQARSIRAGKLPPGSPGVTGAGSASLLQELVQRNQVLRSEMVRLRHAMVEADRKKSELEARVYRK